MVSSRLLLADMLTPGSEWVVLWWVWGRELGTDILGSSVSVLAW